MNSDEVYAYCDRLGINSQGIALLKRLGKLKPESDDGWKRSSYEYGVWSEKMGRHSVGKRQLDVVAFKVREKDANCIEFYHKPPKVTLQNLDSGYNYQPTLF